MLLDQSDAAVFDLRFHGAVPQHVAITLAHRNELSAAIVALELSERRSALAKHKRVEVGSNDCNV